MAINNVLTDPWSDAHDHGEVEDALKAKLLELQQAISEAANNLATLQVSLTELAQAVAGKYDDPGTGGIPKSALSESLRNEINSKANLSALNDKADLDHFGDSGNEMMLNVNQWPRTVVYDITGNNAGAQEGDVAFNPDKSRLYAVSNASNWLDLGTPKKGTIYADSKTKRTYIWNGTFVRVSGDGVGTSVIVGDETVDVYVDGYEGSGADVSDKVMTHINTLQSKIDEFIDDLSSIAFIGEKTPKIGELDWGGTELPKPYLENPSSNSNWGNIRKWINILDDGGNGGSGKINIKGHNFVDGLRLTLVTSENTLLQPAHFGLSHSYVSADEINSASGKNVTITFSEAVRDENCYLVIHSDSGAIEDVVVGIQGRYFESIPQQYSVSVNGEHYVADNNGGGEINEGTHYHNSIKAEDGYTITVVVTDGDGNQTTITDTDGDGWFEIDIESIDGNYTITVTATEIPKTMYPITKSLTNMSCTGDDSVEKGGTWEGVLSPATGYNLPESIRVILSAPIIQPQNPSASVVGSWRYFTYDKSTGAVTISNVNRGLTIVAEGAQDHSGTVKLTKKLLHVTSETEDGFYTTDDDLEIDLSAEVLDDTTTPATTATLNGDVRVLVDGVELFNERTESGVNASGITFSNGVVTIPSTVIDGAEEVVVIATAHTGLVTFQFNGETTSTLFKVSGVKPDGTVKTDIRVTGNDATYDSTTGKSTKTIDYKELSAFSLVATGALCVESIDFGGALFTGNPAEMFKSTKTPILTSITGLVIKAPADSSMDYFADGCKNLTELDTVGWEMDEVTSYNSAFKEMGANASSGFTFDMDYLVSDNCTDLSFMFYGSGIDSVNVGTWDVSNVTTMDSMFMNCANLLELDLENWITTPALTNLDSFANGSNVNAVYLGAFVTAGITEDIEGKYLFPQYTRVHLEAAAPPAASRIFLDKLVDADCEILVRRDYIAAYQADTVWGQYQLSY